ncbi:17 kDa surface antigen [Paracidovorax avenae ATCC 19860]|uniref:17 kDa surface antigen n=1 Tax=Paracidovorax avenae (strain ATCC 19860 / DSM 7227 / CCUG 15838 / JCM 20985 / LMG 2117 / NCPPB 1011) TaxID=643561 RepID=F0Q1C1_PARA1|nr:glycine zipper 2TM domain-containing protein [Paracidovorax avenae]ADX45269.1 17 kDa surface antigen [Paracidovorax avenae ATCC 19860]AVS68470.1 glycine zipper 2TM domain-containing protein [Paracidovorax avenae]
MLKFSRTTAAIATVALAGALGACAEQPRYGSQYPGQPTYSSYPSSAPAGMEYGTVTNIEMLQGRSGSSGVGVGTVAGAVIGGVLGNQVGKGTGRAAATVLGAVGGGVVGNQIENRNGNNDGRAEGYRITVQLDQGGQRAYDVGSPGDLRPGDRVRLNGGQISRM